MKKAVLIINPSSGNEEAKNYETQAREKLAQFFDEVEVKETAEGETPLNLRGRLLRRRSIVFLRWVEMVPSMKPSADLLNSLIVQLLVSFH